MGERERHTHHADSAHIEDFIKGRDEGMQSTPLEIREEEIKREEETKKRGRE